MSFSLWLAFFTAAWAISLSPGPGALCAMTSGLKYGFKRGYWISPGLILGLWTQVLIVGLGLGALLAASELAFNIVKWLGAAYLVYLGYRQFRTDAMPVAVQSQDTNPFRIRDLLVRGWLINVFNPKGTVFMLAVMPQFLDLSKPLAPQYVIIAVTLAATDLVAMGLYTSFAARILVLMRNPRQIRWMNRLFGSLFILAGTVLATYSRHSK